ncbi:MAG: DUF4886 domain-containing protein [Treponema sp.]|nr:DUF4886 domain-containing protein [Treponema sp.]
MKSFFRIIGMVTIIAATAGCPDPDAGPGTKPGTAGAAPYRILAIGNSYSQDAMRYMRDILVKNGAASGDIDIVNAYVGGQSLRGHAIAAQYDLASYDRESFGARGAIAKSSNNKLKDIIAGSEWDYITLQQASADSGKPDTYQDDEIAYLLGFIKEHSANPAVKIGWHMTWAYAENYGDTAFDGYGRDQMAMYNAIIQTVQAKILPNAEFDFIIPAGTAVQNARAVYGDILNSDGTHLNDRGRFIAGAMWLRQIYGFGVNVFDSPYQALNGTTVTLDDMAVIEQCVEDAFNAPFEAEGRQEQ